MAVDRPHTNRSVTALDRAAGSLLLTAALALSGCVMAVAIDTPGFSWVAWFSLVPLFIVIRLASPRLALLYGASWGLCLYLFAAATDNAAIGATIRSLGLLAAVPAIYAYLGARLTRRIGFAPLILAVGWVVVELVLQPLALRQGLLAGTQGNNAFTNLISGFLGYAFVAFLIAFVNAKLISLVGRLAFNPMRLPVMRAMHGQWDRLCSYTIISPPHFYSRAQQPRAPPLAVSFARTE